MYYKTKYISPLGNITLASNGNSLVGLWLEGQKYFCSTVKEEMEEKEDLAVFADTKKWLDDYFADGQPEISGLSLEPKGGMFRQEVWKLLCEIPYGEVTTYGEIAGKIAKLQKKPHMSAQAVGQAVGHNPISIIIPCHRVVGSDGKLTGYAGGLEKKIWLLSHEGVDFRKLKQRRNI